MKTFLYKWFYISMNNTDLSQEHAENLVASNGYMQGSV